MFREPPVLAFVAVIEDSQDREAVNSQSARTCAMTLIGTTSRKIFWSSADFSRSHH